MIIAAIDQLVYENSSRTTVSTAHRAKGREWASVVIADDFAEPVDRKDTPRVDAMLGYVAVTRADIQLDRGGLAWIDRHRRREAAKGGAA